MEPMKPMKPMEPMKPMAPMKPMNSADSAWWPKDLGNPDSSGSQNSTRYAYFSGANRLLVDSDGQVKTYDTAGHRIQGFGQQQGSGGSMTFQSEQGPLALSDLKLVD